MRGLTLTGAAALVVTALASPAAAQLADSVAEFSGTQGGNNWFYGEYQTPGSAASFVQLPNFGGGVWNGGGGAFSLPQVDATGGHPSDEPDSSVRRWQSEFTGTITISGEIQDTQSGGGNGTLVRILNNGVPQQIVRDDAVSGTTIAVTEADGLHTYTSTFAVVTGQFVDFEIDANNDFSFDNTRFTAVIVPEPASLGLLAAGALLALRRRRRGK